MKAFLFVLILFFSAAFSFSQSKSVLFIGNSYTYVNDLPRMVSDMATSAGDTLFYDSHTEGGATFYSHAINTITKDKIKSGHWDIVVLQGQSLELFGYFTGIAYPFPGAMMLDSLIHESNPCAETMFYRTWGRKNGAGSYSYLLMDSLIHINYMNLADTLDAVVSPVGEVWKYVRQHYPAIELYDADESHPSLAGTYAAASCFYSAIFRKDPVNCTYNPGLTSADALAIRTAAREVVYERLPDWHIGEYDAFVNQCRDSSSGATENGPWTIYPNPAAESLTLEFENGFTAPMQLYNCFGALVREFETTAARELINIADLPEGLYIINRKGESEGKKFIKQ